MERNTTAATAGQGLTVSSGGAIAGTADLAGGDLTLKSGISTGLGTSALHFFTATAGLTGITDNALTEKMTILGNGNVGIGTATPTTNKLVVVGDIRVGTSGTNGCIEQFAGTALVGACSSDINLKKNIVPITNILEKFTQLQPVTYEWRTDEFPDRHFGTEPIKGLIAQEVEKLYPELVGMDGRGFKTVDYGIALQMMSIEAIKELNLNLNAVSGTVTPVTNSANETFVTAFFKNIYAKVSTWLADATNGIGDIFAKQINTKTLCVSDDNGAKTCITKSQLDSLLAGAGGSSSGGSSTPICIAPQTLVNNVCTDPASATLESIAITTPATKLSYTVGDTLDITGLEVTGTYSDTTTKVETITTTDISGFDSIAPVTGQTLTITVGGKTTTYTIDVAAVAAVAAVAQ